ncbi:MAG: TIGR01212 family radical SAM protein [Bacillota bacterium]|jgi:radical SAM protein (TIGR01212 family)|nr:TIGR01212 family radical SAM protein [Thermoanaerobacteraceae bacterium]
MEKRYYTFNRFLRERFGGPVYKIPLAAALGCPNRDGTVGSNGCVFCDNRAFSPFVEQDFSITEQIRRFKAGRRQKGRYIAYFQSYTNTYGPVARLRRLYEEALADPEVVGLSVATRPDCVPDEVLDLLESYTGRWMVWIEYGLQSCHDETLERINRGHDFAAFADAVNRTRGRGIYTGAHVIIGLPGESAEEVLETAQALNTVGVDGVKLHQLQVFRGTPLAADWEAGKVRTLEAGEYVSLACDFIETLSPRVVILRLVGDVTDDALLLSPRWGVSKAEVIAAIDRELERRGTRQGSRLPGGSV